MGFSFRGGLGLQLVGAFKYRAGQEVLVPLVQESKIGSFFMVVLKDSSFRVSVQDVGSFCFLTLVLLVFEL